MYITGSEVELDSMAPIADNARLNAILHFNVSVVQLKGDVAYSPMVCKCECRRYSDRQFKLY